VLNRFSDTQIWILNFLLVTLVLLGGIWIGSLDDPSEIPPPEQVMVPTMEGDFDDVEMSVRSTSGNTWRWLCDMHFNVDPNKVDTAECDYTEP
jgi:hypothetical protein